MSATCVMYGSRAYYTDVYIYSQMTTFLSERSWVRKKKTRRQHSYWHVRQTRRGLSRSLSEGPTRLQKLLLSKNKKWKVETELGLFVSAFPSERKDPLVINTRAVRSRAPCLLVRSTSIMVSGNNNEVTEKQPSG